MVKADPKRDYYHELDLAPKADTEDIKKQFRRLALVYHPDRNRGREAEVVGKFQAIQEAHEILIDPDLRSKYDADRRKYTGAWAPPPSRPDPFRRSQYATYSDYPPPPRRTQPKPAPTRPEPSRPEPSRPEPSRPEPSRPVPPRPEYASASTATNGPGRYANWTKPAPPPPPKKPATTSNYDAWKHMNPNRAREPEENKARYEQTYAPPKPPMGRSNTTRVPKKSGYDPTASGHNQDEPSAPGGHSAYSRTSRHFPAPPPRPAPDAAPTATSSPNPQSQTPDPNVPFTEGRPRMSAPYASSGSGERLVFSTDNMKRSASTRSSPRTKEWTDPFPSPANHASGRPRSLSPSARKSQSNTGATDQHKNKGDPSKRHGGNAKKPFNVFGGYSSESSEEDESPTAFNKRPGGPPKKSQTPKSDKHKGHAHKAPAPARPTGPNYQSTPTKSQENIFSFSVHDNMFNNTSPNTFRSRSAENINTTFSPGDWEGKFKGSEDFAIPPPKRGSSSRGSPVRGSPVRAKSSRTQTDTSMPPPPPPPRPANVAPSGLNDVPIINPHPAKFSKEEWEQHFKNASWVNFPPPKSTSPTRNGSASNRRAKPNQARKVPTVTPKVASVSDEQDEPTLHDPKASEATEAESNESNGDGNAMDIDTDIPAVAVNNPPREPPVKVVPSTLKRPNAIPPPPLYPPRAQTSSAPTSATKAKGPGINIRLDDLAQVEPMLPSKEGLQNLADLQSNLPFNSRASFSGPFNYKPPVRASLPARPEAPKAPPAPHRLTATAWATYLDKMRAYFGKWSTYNSTMLDRFQERQKTLQSDFDVGCIAKVGETSDKIGFDTYKTWVKEDEKDRMHWSVCCDKHQEVLEEAAKLRDRVSKYGLSSDHS